MSKVSTAAPVKENNDSAVRNAETRAKQAEQKIKQLEREVAELKQNRKAPAQAPVPSESLPFHGDSIEMLRREPMMAHLLDALDAGKDIGHYGRLVFAMVAHHFLPSEQVLAWLDKDPDFGHDQAIALLRQVTGRDYSPPRRERILAWHRQQEFPILPNLDDPDCGNVYRNLKFPDKVYNHIQEYQEDKIEAQGGELFPAESAQREE